MFGSAKRKTKPGKIVIVVVPVKGKSKKHEAIEVPPEGTTLNTVLKQLGIAHEKRDFTEPGGAVALDAVLTVPSGKTRTIEVHERPEGS